VPADIGAAKLFWVRFQISRDRIVGGDQRPRVGNDPKADVRAERACDLTPAFGKLSVSPTAPGSRSSRPRRAT
jgi:hypothetical protein